MANTTNYNWETPDDTDLVKDGAAAIRTLGSSIDSTVFTNASNAINKSIVDAKGDLIAATAADTVARLAVGTNGQALLADSSTATGLRWGSASATQSWTLISSQAVSSGNSVSFTGLTGQYDNLLVTWSRFTTSWGNDWGIRFNSDSNFNYRWIRLGSGTTAYNNDNSASAQNAFYLDYGGPNFGLGFARISGAASNGNKLIEMHYNARNPVNDTNISLQAFAGTYTATAPLSSIQLQMLNGSQTYTAGSQFYLYGA